MLNRLWLWFYTELPAWWSIPSILFVVLLIVAGLAG
jgi:hypothetical protein